MTLGSIAVDAKRIECLVLVVAGAEDVAIPPRIQRRIARKYGAERCGRVARAPDA
jgi:hypothetical protein